MQPFLNINSITYERGGKMNNISQGTRDNLKEIMNEFSDMVYRLALARTKNISDAEDVFQEVFLRYFKHQEKLQSHEHIRFWLIRVTINCSKSLLTSPWFRHTVPLKEELSFSSKEKGEVYYAVLEMPIKYRTVIYLFYFEDLSITEISKITGIKETTVKSQLSRGRKIVKENLKGVINDV